MTIRASILALCALALGTSGPCPSDPDGVDETARPGSLVVRSDGTARVTGTVLANEQHCAVDGQCWLVLSAAGATVRVVYVETEGVPTVNETAAESGFAARPGDVVEVYGALQNLTGSPLLSTCAGENYYIRPLRPPLEP